MYLKGEVMKLSTKLAQTQHDEQRKKFNKDIAELSGTAKAAIEFRVQNEEIDFALFNYILTVHDFTDVKDLNEAVMKMYRFMYVHMMNLQRANEEMKDLLMAYRAEEENAERRTRLDTVVTKESPFLMAHKFLRAIQERAKNRSKSGIISYTPDEAKDMGLKV